MTFMQEVLEQNTLIWDKCAETPFVRELQLGTLPLEKFKCYMIQDSIYLKNYARVYGQAVFCSTTLKDIQLYYSILSFVTDTESKVRLNYLEQFGITDDDIEFMEPLPENKKYIEFLLETANRGNICEILLAVLPCMLSYSYIFRKIAEMPGSLESKYIDLIQDYADPHYYEDCVRWTSFADEKCSFSSEQEKRYLKKIFQTASLLELDFWQMAYESHPLSIIDFKAD